MPDGRVAPFSSFVCLNTYAPPLGMVEMTGKAKTSIYIDGALWRRFKRYSSGRGKEMTSLMGEMIEEEMLEDSLDKQLDRIAREESIELDFEPVEPKTGSVSELIRSGRDHGNRRLSGQ